MEIKGDKALTPNKTQYLVQQMKDELDSTQNAIQNSDLSMSSISLIDTAKNQLQTLLNKFLEKKGVITPSETAEAIEKMNALKRARLEKDFVLGIRKGTWFMIAIVGLSVGAYFYYKKRANG
jgi:hypothetical protein